MNQTERRNRVIAQGEHSNHSHVVVGDANVTRNHKGEILIELGNSEAVLRHLIESEWVNEEKQIWTEEHKDIPLTRNDHRVAIGDFIGRHGDVALKKVAPRTYKYVPQLVFDPLKKRIERAKD